MIIRAGRFGYRGRALSKWPVVTRSCYQLAIIPVCIQERKQNVFEWLYSRLGNSRFRGCHAWGCCVPPFGTYVRVREILCGLRMYPYVHMKLRSLLIAHTWYVYVMRTRLPKAALRAGFKGAISRYFRGIDIIFWFSDSLRVPYVNSKRNTAYRLFKLVTVYRYNISINNDII